MSDTPLKFLDQEGVKYLWSKISMQDYPNNELLAKVITAIDETKADKDDLTGLKEVYVGSGEPTDESVIWIDPETPSAILCWYSLDN
jgi:hypothetical protein